MKFRWIITITIVGLLFLYIFIRLEKSNIISLNQKHKVIEIEDEISGRITSLRKRNGICFISTNSGHYTIMPSENNNYKKEFIDEHLSIGDSIIKQSGSDTIKIYDGKRYYTFIHKDVISE